MEPAAIKFKQLAEEGITIKTPKRRLKSIAVKWSLTVVAIITIAVLLIFAANTMFLGKYYVRKNRALFYHEYESFKSKFVHPDVTTRELLREKDRKTGFMFYIAEMSGQQPVRIVQTSVPNFRPDENIGPGKDNRPWIELPKEQIKFISANSEFLQQGETLFGRVHRGNNAKAEFDLVFAAQLDIRYLLIIVRPVEQLDEHTAIANQFLLIIGLLAICISIIMAKLSAKSVVEPIKEITAIGEHIANLDFSHRYTGSACDEIGTLGKSINRISVQLNSAMRNFEETNRKLQIEMNLQKRFFAGVSHELKTPVGLIRGYSESLKLGLAKTPEEIAEFSNIILDETDRLNHLVSDILFLVKSESAEFLLDLRKIDLIPVLEDSIEKNMPRIHEKNIQIIKDLLPNAVLVRRREQDQADI